MPSKLLIKLIFFFLLALVCSDHGIEALAAGLTIEKCKPNKAVITYDGKLLWLMVQVLRIF